jgi:hypothetical protein
MLLQADNGTSRLIFVLSLQSGSERVSIHWDERSVVRGTSRICLPARTTVVEKTVPLVRPSTEVSYGVRALRFCLPLLGSMSLGLQSAVGAGMLAYDHEDKVLPYRARTSLPSGSSIASGAFGLS